MKIQFKDCIESEFCDKEVIVEFLQVTEEISLKTHYTGRLPQWHEEKVIKFRLLAFDAEDKVVINEVFDMYPISMVVGDIYAFSNYNEPRGAVYYDKVWLDKHMEDAGMFTTLRQE